MLPTIATGNVASALAGEYEVANSCRFNSDAYMVKNIVTPTNQKKYTISVWVKRSVISSRQRIFSVIDTSNTAAYSYLEFQSDDRLNFDDFDGSSTRLTRTTNRLFRDPSAWYNIIIAVDTTLSSASSRVKMYINGTEETDFVVTSNASQDFNTTTLNSSKTFRIAEHGTAGFRFGGYMCEFVLVDGSQLDETSFGEFDSDSSNIWKPIDVSDLTFGNNGFYLDFEDSSNLGNDANGGTDFTETSLAATDQSTDTCTNNFATLNPLHRGTHLSDATFSEGNLKHQGTSSGGNYPYTFSTIGASQGKWYAEFKVASDPSTTMIGIASGIADSFFGGTGTAKGYALYGNSGNLFTSGSGSSYGSSLSVGDILAVAMDLDNNKLYFSKNGTFHNSGDPTSGSTGTGAVSITAPASNGTGVYHFACGKAGSATTSIEANFGSPSFSISSGNADANGHGNFEYSVPSGYFALCTKNLAENG